VKNRGRSFVKDVDQNFPPPLFFTRQREGEEGTWRERWIKHREEE